MKKLSIFLAVLMILLCISSCQSEPIVMDESQEWQETTDFIKGMNTSVETSVPSFAPYATQDINEYRSYVNQAEMPNNFVDYDAISFLGNFLMYESSDSGGRVAIYTLYEKDRSQFFHFSTAFDESFTMRYQSALINADEIVKEGNDLRYIKSGTYYLLYSGSTIEESEHVILYEYEFDRLIRILWECDGVLFELIRTQGFDTITDSTLWINGLFYEDSALKIVQNFNTLVRNARNGT